MAVANPSDDSGSLPDNPADNPTGDPAGNSFRPLTAVNSPVSEALILICDKCGSKLATGSISNPAQELKTCLKESIRTLGQKDRFRAATTSCLGLCPEGKATVAIATSDQTRFFTIEGDALMTGVRECAEFILNEAKK